MNSRLLLTLTLALFATPAFADPPSASYLFPAGGRRGTTVEVRLGGLNLHSRCGFELLGPGVAAERIATRMPTLWFDGPMLELAESQQQEDYPKDMASRVRIVADAPLGIRHGRIWTSQGAASGLGFIVGDLPEIVERETDGPDEFPRVTLPVTINGRIFPREDIDEWIIALKRGQHVSAEVVARQFGSPLIAQIDLRDAAGRVVAEQDSYPGESDARLSFIALTDGEYRVRVSDARLGGGQTFVYRLTLRAGTKLQSNDTPPPLKAMSPPLSEQGRIAVPKELDSWLVDLKKARSYTVDLKARRLRSPLAPLVVVRDPAGKELTRFDGATQDGDPTLQVKPLVDGIHRVEIADRFATRGGPAFRYALNVIEVSPELDFTLRLATDAITVTRGGTAKVKVAVERRGDMKAPIALTVEGLPPGVTAAPAVIAPDQLGAEIALSATGEAPITATRIIVRGRAKLPTGEAARTATTTVRPDLTVDSELLAVAMPTPFRVTADYLLTSAPRGGVLTKRYRIERNGFVGPITVTLADKQARHLQGVTGPTLLVPADKSEFDYPITMPPWMETGRTCRACVMAIGEVKDKDGKLHEVSFSSTEQNMQLIAVTEPGRLGLELAAPSVRLVGEPTLAFRVRRGEGIIGSVKIELLPTLEVAADAVTLPADQSTGAFTIKRSSTGPATARSAIVRASVMHRGHPVTAEAKFDLVPP